jgi:hypothetical protein
MPEPLALDLRLMRAALETLLAHVERIAGTRIEVDHDYFWSVPPDELYDMGAPPSELTIGQLSECLDNLRGIAEDPEKAVAYGLVWAAEVLRAVGLAVPG